MYIFCYKSKKILKKSSLKYYTHKDKYIFFINIIILYITITKIEIVNYFLQNYYIARTPF